MDNGTRLVRFLDVGFGARLVGLFWFANIVTSSLTTCDGRVVVTLIFSLMLLVQISSLVAHSR
jgi:hypothetical protein